ncbi:LTA synthase family protein [Geofilum sp. OHC36d9]|uniref:LTA synthase family protein n=1 Tax=Geofilum sp. OHC36d9 TaxID=3458413 RepID=UPI0040348FF0
MIKFLKYLLKTAIFWLLLFAFYRGVFILFNISYSGGTPLGILAKSFLTGLHLDLSMTSYLILLLSVIQTVTVSISRRFSYKALHVTNLILITIFTALLLGNINLYAYWGRLLDAEGFSFLKTPWVILASVKWYESILFMVIWGGFAWAAIYLYSRWTKHFKSSQSMAPLNTAIAAFLTLFTAAVMIIPIRGGFGVAPINTGIAYFSSYNYANHAAVNPLWNLFYSFKRMDARTRHYKFMDEDKALAIYNELRTVDNDSIIKILKTDRPNVVIILMESFSAQVVGCLGGEQVTPNLDSLAHQGILFSNIYAASDRSDKGIVATLAGYQVMPAYSIIQYPAKSQSLSFLPQKMKQAGYGHLSYMYGGDIGFKGMNSFVTLSGFPKVITIDDFPSSTRGKKWGVHDEFTFSRLAKDMKNDQSDQPFFKFFFTLSSHEPFDVPMETVYRDPYLNSIHYTDRCLGQFIKQVKDNGLWDNTLFILIADHGTPGPRKATSQMPERYHIPMIWTGGALAVTDTTITKLGSQKDMVATLLGQLNIDASEFRFSKNILSTGTHEYAFFTYPDAFGYVTPTSYQVYDNTAKKYVMQTGSVSQIDSLRGKAYLQVLSADHLKR